MPMNEMRRNHVEIFSTAWHKKFKKLAAADA